MAKASREQVEAAIAFAQNHPTADVEAIMGETGVSRTTARRAQQGSLGNNDERVTETADIPSGSPASPRTDGARGSRRASSGRRARATRRELVEPHPDAVEALYTLSCTVAAVGLSFLPPQYQLTEVDRQMILLPLSRMYLRRQSVPVISPDGQDMFTIVIGVLGYAVHATSGRYAGRDARARGAGRIEVPGANPFSGAAPAQGNGAAGAAVPQPDGARNPYDPQTVMDNLEQELRAAAAARAESEAMEQANGPNA